jgi:hypothetical protein
MRIGAFEQLTTANRGIQNGGLIFKRPGHHYLAAQPDEENRLDNSDLQESLVTAPSEKLVDTA